MLALADISAQHWVSFIGAVLLFLAIDLGVFHRRAHVVRFREALAWTMLWAVLAVVFAVKVAPAWTPGWSRVETVEFLTGYLIELSLSMDNVFVIALIFAYFRVPAESQHRVLFWGIVGALVMRGALIVVGAALIARFHWLLYLLGAFLVVSGYRMLVGAPEGVEPARNPVVRLVRRFFPVADDFAGQKFFTRQGGRRVLTPLALVLVVVETTDLVFALDSIPAIFAVTEKAFIVFTSNIFAILGLRSLYFVLAGAIDCFRFLKAGLSVVLVFIGLKMLAAKWVRIPTTASLLVVVGILAVCIVGSWVAVRIEKRRP